MNCDQVRIEEDGNCHLKVFGSTCLERPKEVHENLESETQVNPKYKGCLIYKQTVAYTPTAFDK